MLVRLTLRHEVAEDLLQDLFVRLHASAAFRKAVNPRAYARRAAMRLAFDWYAAQRRAGPGTGDSVERADPSPGALAQLIEAERRSAVLEAVSQLPEPGRTVIVLRYLAGEPYDQIAPQINRSAHQTRSVGQKALARLRAALSDRCSAATN
jgi:RNA polymerase sigma factor (sigma-70 family)